MLVVGKFFLIKMKLYLISNQKNKKIKEPTLPRIDFFMEFVDISDEKAVSDLAINSGIDKNAFDFLLSGIDLSLFEEDFDPNEIEYFDSKKVLSSINKFISLHSELNSYTKEIDDYLKYCISNKLKVCTYFAY
ncbi:hypothetical protein GCM10027035_17880 [Emticicia sediminis]